MAKPSSAQKRLYPKTRVTPRSKDLPITLGMLRLVQGGLEAKIKESNSDLKSEIHGVRAEVRELDSRMEARFGGMDARFGRMEERFAQIDARFDRMEARFSGIDARFETIDARFEKVMEAIHSLSGQVTRIGILVEEQNSRNNIVLEGLTGLAQRQDRLEERIDSVETTVHSIARSKR